MSHQPTQFLKFFSAVILSATACLEGFAPALSANPAKEAKPVAVKNSTATAAKLPTLTALHAVQQHNRLGVGDMYVSGLDVKWIFNDGDLYCMYRGEDRSVSLVCTSKKAVFTHSLEDFRKKGISFTQGDQDQFAKRVTLKAASKAGEFQKFPTKKYSIQARASAGHGEIRMVEIGSETGLATPTKTPEMAEFVTLAYGLPKIDSLALDMRTNFYVPDGSLWFKTSEKDMAKTAYPAGQARLKTIRLENVKVPGDFFTVPKDYKKADSQEKIMGMASAAKDFTDLMFAEPKLSK